MTTDQRQLTSENERFPSQAPPHIAKVSAVVGGQRPWITVTMTLLGRENRLLVGNYWFETPL